MDAAPLLILKYKMILFSSCLDYNYDFDDRFRITKIDLKLNFLVDEKTVKVQIILIR